VEAQRSGLVGEIRAEIAGDGRTERHQTLRGWLDGACPSRSV
jgi:hypothetical protein